MRLITNEELNIVSGSSTKLTGVQTTIDAVKESAVDVWNVLSNWISASSDSSGGRENSPIEDLREKINYSKNVAGEANAAGCKAFVSFAGDTSAFPLMLAVQLAQQILRMEELLQREALSGLV